MKAFALLILVSVSWLGGAWLLTLLVGALHSWWPLIPAMGYGQALHIKGVLVLGVISVGVLRAVVGVVAE